MRVKILAPYGCDRTALDEKSWAEMPEGSTLRDALRLVGCSAVKARMLLVCVNGVRSPLGTELRDGDVIGFFSLVTGG